MAAPKRGINLLPKSEFERSFSGRFLQWAITSGRYIIVIVEAVVILAFLSRFKLDQDLADLSNAIEGQKRILLSQVPQEAQFRNTQARMEAASVMINKQMQSGKLYDEVVRALPPQIKVENITLKRDQISLTGSSTSEEAMGLMFRALLSHEGWYNLNLTNISTQNGSTISFSLNISH